MDNILTNATQSHPAHSFEEDFPPSLGVIFFAFNVLLLLFGCGGNGLVMVIILRYRKLRDSTMTFLLHLSVTDFITAMVSCFYGLSYDLDIRNRSYISCIILEQTVTYTIFVSQFVLAVVSFDRYIAVCHNVKYPKIITKTLVKILLSTAWIVPVIFTIIPVFEFNNWDIVQRCMYHNLFHDWVYKMYSTLMIVMMIFPLVFYVKVLAKARQFYRKFCPAQIQGINASTMKVLQKKQSIKNGKIMGFVTLAFILCWFPFPIFQYQFGIDFNMNTNANKTFMMVIFNMGLMNAAINPLIYTWQKKDFQTEARRMLKCIKCCKGENPNRPSSLKNQVNRIPYSKTKSNATHTTTISGQNVQLTSLSRKRNNPGIGESFSLNKTDSNNKMVSTSQVTDPPRIKTVHVKPFIVSD